MTRTLEIPAFGEELWGSGAFFNRFTRVLIPINSTKRHVLTEGDGVPIALRITAANEHDKWGLADLLDARILRPCADTTQNLCLDKGYDYADVRTAIARRGYVEHIRCRGEEQRACRRGTRARRWVVERTHSWLNRFRRLQIRWEKKADNYAAMLHLACAYITFRAAGVMG